MKKTLMNKTSIKDLYEKVREYDELISIPHSVRYSELNNTKNTLGDLIKQVDELNSIRHNEKEKNIKLIRIYNQCMNIIAELLEESLKKDYDHKLSMKKSRYVIDRLKQYIESKEDLDAEIPSDDDEEESSDDKDKEMKGLSAKERQIIKSIK
jgi:hypothetical protein